MSATKQSLDALRIIFWTWLVASLRGPLHWVVTRALLAADHGSTVDQMAVFHAVNRVSSCVGIGCSVVLVVALTRITEWQRANVWVRAALFGFVAQAAISVCSIGLSLTGARSRELGNLIWGTSTVIHAVAPALLVAVLHRARHPRGWAPWLWALFGWIALIDLALPLSSLLLEWNPLAGVGGDVMWLLLGSVSDVVILLLILDVRRRLAAGEVSPDGVSPPTSFLTAPEKWRETAGALAFYSRALGWRLAVGVCGAMLAGLAQAAGGAGQVVLVLSSLVGLVISGMMVFAMAQLTRAPAESRAGGLIGAATAMSGMALLADLYSFALLVELAGEHDRYLLGSRALERLPWAAGLGGLVGFAGSIVFLTGLRALASGLARSDLADDAGRLIIALGVTAGLSVAAVAAAALVNRPGVELLLIAVLVFGAAIWILVRYFSLLRRLHDAMQSPQEPA